MSKPKRPIYAGDLGAGPFSDYLTAAENSVVIRIWSPVCAVADAFTPPSDLESEAARSVSAWRKDCTQRILITGVAEAGGKTETVAKEVIADRRADDGAVRALLVLLLSLKDAVLQDPCQKIFVSVIEPKDPHHRDVEARGAAHPVLGLYTLSAGGVSCLSLLLGADGKLTGNNAKAYLQIIVRALAHGATAFAGDRQLGALYRRFHLVYIPHTRSPRYPARIRKIL